MKKGKEGEKEKGEMAERSTREEGPVFDIHPSCIVRLFFQEAAEEVSLSNMLCVYVSVYV